MQPLMTAEFESEQTCLGGVSLALSGSTSQRFRNGFQCGLAATSQHLESLAALAMASCVTGTGYCVLPWGRSYNPQEENCPEQVPCGHSLRELEKHLHNALRLLGCLILVGPFPPRRFCDSKQYCRASSAQRVSC